MFNLNLVFARVTRFIVMLLIIADPINKSFNKNGILKNLSSEKILFLTSPDPLLSCCQSKLHVKTIRFLIKKYIFDPDTIF